MVASLMPRNEHPPTDLRKDDNAKTEIMCMRRQTVLKELGSSFGLSLLDKSDVVYLTKIGM